MQLFTIGLTSRTACSQRYFRTWSISEAPSWDSWGEGLQLTVVGRCLLEPRPRLGYRRVFQQFVAGREKTTAPVCASLENALGSGSSFDRDGGVSAARALGNHHAVACQCFPGEEHNGIRWLQPVRHSHVNLHDAA